MPPDDFNLSQTVRQLLVLALRQPSAVVDLGNKDIDLLIRLARQSRLHGRIAAELKKAGVFGRLDQVARDQFESALRMAEARDSVARWELDRIDWALEDGPTVTIVCLKGIAYSLLGLPNTPGRIFADVDFLVAEEDLDTIEQALNSRGWMTQQLSPYDDNYYRRWTHELPPLVHIERDVEIDLHHNIVPRTARLNPQSSMLIESAMPIENSRYLVPCESDMVLHAATHLMFDSDLADKLRDLLDIADLVEFFAQGDDQFWNSLLDRAQELDLTRPTFYALRYASMILASDVPAVAVERASKWGPPAPLRWLMDHLVMRTILPPHPDQKTTYVAFCRLLLYMRSHWLRMPPWLLVYHLTVKFFMRRFPQGKNTDDQAE